MNDVNFSYTEQMLGTHAQSALIKLIYKKVMNVHPSTINEFSSGELVNFVQTDSLKLYDYVSCVGWLLNVPILLACCFTILFYLLGVSFFSGIAVFIVSFIVNALLAAKSAHFYELYMKK